MIKNLTTMRIQLSSMQTNIANLISEIDKLILDEVGEISNTPNSQFQNLKKNGSFFPPNVNSKRDKLKDILGESRIPLSARDIKEILKKNNEDLPNIDQSLVNLEKADMIKATNEQGRKKYFLKK